MPYNKKRQIEAESDDEAPQVAKKAKGENVKAKKDLSKGTDADGNCYWEVSFLSFHFALQMLTFWPDRQQPAHQYFSVQRRHFGQHQRVLHGSRW
jgi:hypothetical protein